VEHLIDIPVIKVHDAVAQNVRGMPRCFDRRVRAARLGPLLQDAPRAIVVLSRHGPPDDMSRPSVDLQVEYLHVEYDVRGVVDGGCRDAELAELLLHLGIVLERQRHAHAVCVEVGFPRIVRLLDSGLPF